jgi:ABC-type transport system substrate-binding protein
MKGPRNMTMMMESFALQWNLISKKATLEANKGNLREVDNHPGTGPFVYSRRTTDRWIQTANPNYWNAGKGPNGCPCVDSIEHVWLKAWTPELAAALLGGVVDWAQWLDLKTGRTIGNQRGLNGLVQSIPVIAGVGWHHERKPYDDKRVRKALALVIDGPALVDATVDVKGFNVGEWFINGTPFALDPVKVRQTPGLRRPTPGDIAEAKRLLSEAGFPDGRGFPRIDLLTRDTPDNKIVNAAIQAMLKQHLDLNAEIRIADASGIADETRKGNFDITGAGCGILLIDPSAYIGQCVGEGNDIRYKNAEVNRLINQLAVESDQTRRIQVVNQMREIFLDDWPMKPFSAGESVFWGYWDHVKGMIPGSFTAGYELYRWDSVWLERK